MDRSRETPSGVDRQRRTRVALCVAALVAAFAVLLSVVDRLTPAPSGPASSSYATAPDGLGAYAELLRRSGHPVRRLRDAPSDASLDPRSTMIVLDPDVVTPEQAHALARSVRAGGRLVAGGTGPQGWLDGVLHDPPAWVDGGTRDARPLVPVPETRAVRTVRTGAEGHFERLGPALALLGPARRPPVAAVALGHGRLVLLADPSPLQNRGLAAADNAAFAVELAGPRGRPVVFVESVHGFGTATGLAALPGRFRWALALLGVAGLTAMAASARRLGPAEAAEREQPPPRSAYVDAVAATLARAGRPGEAAAPLRRAALAALRRRAGPGAADPSDPAAELAALRAAALRLDLTEAEAAAVIDGPTGDDAPVLAGRALAKLEAGPR